MKKRIYAFLALLSTASCQAEIPKDSMGFYYQGTQFEIPANPSSIGFTGSSDDFILFKYGEEKGSNYLSLGNMLNDDPVQYKCTISNLLKATADTKHKNPCDKTELKTFQGAFEQFEKLNVQSPSNAEIYAAKTNKASLLFVLTGGKTLKIESDFMSIDELRNSLVEK